MSDGVSTGPSDGARPDPGPPAVADPRPDRALLAAHVAGEPDAFDELVRRHVDRLWVFALRVLEHREDAADAVQDALIAAFRSAAGYRGESEVSTWLHRIVLNACRDRLRRRRIRLVEPLGDHDVPGRRDSIDEHLTRLSVTEALGLLPVDQRLPIVLVDVQGFSVAEAAEILGVPDGTIKSRCARGRARLARTLGHLRPRGNETAAADVEEATGPDRPSPRARRGRRRAPHEGDRGGGRR